MSEYADINDPFNLRDSAGRIDPNKCLTLASKCLLSQRGVATDEMVEIAETVVPALVAEIQGISEDQLDASAKSTFDTAKEKHLAKLLKALDAVQIDALLQNIRFTLPPLGASRDDPIVFEVSVPPDKWELVPELSSRLKRLKDARAND